MPFLICICSGVRLCCLMLLRCFSSHNVHMERNFTHVASWYGDSHSVRCTHGWGAEQDQPLSAIFLVLSVYSILEFQLFQIYAWSCFAPHLNVVADWHSRVQGNKNYDEEGHSGTLSSSHISVRRLSDLICITYIFTTGRTHIALPWCLALWI